MPCAWCCERPHPAHALGAAPGCTPRGGLSHTRDTCASARASKPAPSLLLLLLLCLRSCSPLAHRARAARGRGPPARPVDPPPLLGWAHRRPHMHAARQLRMWRTLQGGCSRRCRSRARSAPALSLHHLSALTDSRTTDSPLQRGRPRAGRPPGGRPPIPTMPGACVARTQPARTLGAQRTPHTPRPFLRDPEGGEGGGEGQSSRPTVGD